jgi:serine phosphatase RsbU (regulator of sigma subunit)/PAS domain-containing protein
MGRASEPERRRPPGPGAHLWRPPQTRELIVGLALALTLPLAASWLTTEVAVFEDFPGLTFLAATVTATLMGRLSASVVATATSAILVASNGLLPQAADEEPLVNLLALAFFVSVSAAVAYALVQKDAASERGGLAASRIEDLARELELERNTLQQVLQQMPGGVVVAAADGTLMTNERAGQIFNVSIPGGHRLEEYRDMPELAALRAFHPDGTPYPPEEGPLVRALQGEVIRNEIMVVERADGSKVTVQVDAAPIGRSEAGVEGAVATFHDVTERLAMQADLARASERLRQVQTITDAALGGLGVDDLVALLLPKVRDALRTDSATLLLVDRTGTLLVEHSTVGAESDGAEVPVPIGRGIAGKIASTVAPIVADDLSTYEVERLWLAKEMRSLMGVPLVYRGRVRGVVHVATREPRHFTPDDVHLAELAANRIAAALERAALYDSQASMALELQRSLLPSTLPSIDGVELAALYRPYSADHEIGGDFYDIFPHGEGTWGVVVGDVSGKGPRAAAIMGLAAHTARAIARYESKPSAVLTALNEVLLREERVNEEQFCTACDLRLKTDHDRLRITLCSAGHPLPMLMRADGSVEQVGEPGTLLGSFDDPELHDVMLDLGPGDALVAYTDGLVERRESGLQDGQRDLAELLSSCHGFTADGIVTLIEHALVDAADIEDDVAVFVIRKT